MGSPFPQLLNLPCAFGSDGSILIGATHIYGTMAPLDLADEAVLRGDYRVFVGVRLPRGMRKQFLRDLDDPIAEIVGGMGLDAYVRSRKP